MWCHNSCSNIDATFLSNINCSFTFLGIGCKNIHSRLKKSQKPELYNRKDNLEQEFWASLHYENNDFSFSDLNQLFFESNNFIGYVFLKK